MTLTAADERSSGSKSALITGGNGLLARNLYARLSARGWRVVSLGHAELDIIREEDVRSAVQSAQPSVVINCAATADVDRCETEPDWAFAVNETGPRFLARAASEAGAEVVHVSTDYVFDGARQGLYTQEDEPNPLSVYAKSKLAGEAAARAETQKAYVIRTSWIFGHGGKNFGSRVVELARTGARLKGVTDQTSIPTYAPDLAGRIIEILDLGVHGLYHVTNTGVATWYDFAKLALERAGLRDFEIAPVTRAELQQSAPRPQNSAMRCLLSEKLGFEELRHWKDALADFVQLS